MRPSTIANERWRWYSACEGMSLDLFFPDTERGASEAKQVCDTCCVRAICLIYALSNHINWGIWGGMTPRERKRHRRSIDQSSQLNDNRTGAHIHLASYG